MASLHDIPRKPFFKAPEEYFERLPAQIQARIAAEHQHDGRRVVVRYALRYALPVIVVAAAFLYYRSGDPDAETILASVETEALIDYLHDTGMSTEEIIDNVELTPGELEELEDEVYDLTFDDLDRPGKEKLKL